MGREELPHGWYKASPHHLPQLLDIFWLGQDTGQDFHPFHYTSLIPCSLASTLLLLSSHQCKSAGRSWHQHQHPALPAAPLLYILHSPDNPIQQLEPELDKWPSYFSGLIILRYVA